jgi:hypothetical protein
MDARERIQERIPTAPRARTTARVPARSLSAPSHQPPVTTFELNRGIAESKELATVRSTAAAPTLNSSPSSLRR